jgi:hypothetical protein
MTGLIVNVLKSGIRNMTIEIKWFSNDFIVSLIKHITALITH